MAWPSERFILAPVMGGVVVAALVLGTILYRSSFQLEQIRERSLVEATLLVANEKADRLDKRIIEQDNLTRRLTEHDSIDTFGEAWLDIAEVQTPTGQALVLVDLAAPNREIRAFVSRAKGIEDDRLRRLLLYRLWPELQLGGPGSEELRHLHVDLDGVSYLLSHWEKQRDGRRYLVVLFHDVPRIVHDLFPQIYSEDQGQPSRVHVVDGKGRIVFGPSLSRGRLTLGRQFATTLYKWRVNVSMTASEELTRVVERRRIIEMVLLGLSSAVVLLGVVVVLFAATRERKLALMKSDFVANVSHELKTPLALVRMFSENLLTGRVPKDKERKYLEVILAESERLSALIDNILDFARVERGKTAFAFRLANLNEVLQRAAEAGRARAERHGILVHTDLGEEEMEANVDERAIEIAVLNLIDNAIKYAPESPEVWVKLERAKERYVVSVKDRGPGIPLDQQQKIFERFVRGQARPGEAVRGSGIGLSLVEQIAKAHGGQAWVTSPCPSEDRGSIFSFSLRRG